MLIDLELTVNIMFVKYRQKYDKIHHGNNALNYLSNASNYWFDEVHAPCVIDDER